MNVCVCLRYCVLSLCFFFKQKTAYEVRSRYWSSDVCSADLEGIGRRERADHAATQVLQHRGHIAPDEVRAATVVDAVATGKIGEADFGQLEIAARCHGPLEAFALVPGAGLARDHAIGADARHWRRQGEDRKSTRLNSSH